MATAAEIVAAVDDCIYGRIDAGGVRDYMINGRRLTTYGLSELLQLRSYYQQLVNEADRGGRVTYGKFGRPSSTYEEDS